MRASLLKEYWELKRQRDDLNKRLKALNSLIKAEVSPDEPLKQDGLIATVYTQTRRTFDFEKAEQELDMRTLLPYILIKTTEALRIKKAA